MFDFEKLVMDLILPWLGKALMIVLVIPFLVALVGALVAGWGYLLYLGANWVFS